MRGRGRARARWPAGARRRDVEREPERRSNRRLLAVEFGTLAATAVSALAAVVASVVALHAIDVGQDQAARAAHQQRLDSGIANLASESATVRNAGMTMLSQTVISELERASHTDSESDRSDVRAMYLTVVKVFENYVTTWRERAQRAEQGPADYHVPTDVENAVRQLTEVTDADVLPLAAEIDALVELDLAYAPLAGVALGGPDFGRFRMFAEGIDLRHSNLAASRWDQAYLSRASLECAIVLRASFYAANLSYANLAGADLRGADLRNANLANADLRAADLRGADLTGAEVHGASFAGADLTGAVWDDAPAAGTYGIGAPVPDGLLERLGTCITRAGYTPAGTSG